MAGTLAMGGGAGSGDSKTSMTASPGAEPNQVSQLTPGRDHAVFPQAHQVDQLDTLSAKVRRHADDDSPEPTLINNVAVKLEPGLVPYPSY